MSQYPKEAGWKDPTVSKLNSERLNRLGITRKNSIRMADLYANGFIGTSTQASEVLDMNLLTGRPIATQLFKQGILRRVEMIHDRNNNAHWKLAYNHPELSTQGEMFND